MLALAAALGLALVHLFAGKLRFLEAEPRSRWLSFAGGISVAYVFLHLLPEIAEGQEALRSAIRPLPGSLRNHAYLVALLGLAMFYGLERLARESRDRRRGRGEGGRTESKVFWIHIASFALYNLLIGYLLLHREERGATALLLFSVAIALHFVVNDFGLREHHQEQYRRVGRWVVSAAVLAGWGVGMAWKVSQALLSGLMAFLAGGIILNVLKEELPEERRSQFGAFALGLGMYAILLLAL
jgi:zinc transporter ZupT